MSWPINIGYKISHVKYLTRVAKLSKIKVLRDDLLNNLVLCLCVPPAHGYPSPGRWGVLVPQGHRQDPHWQAGVSTFHSPQVPETWLQGTGKLQSHTLRWQGKSPTASTSSYKIVPLQYDNYDKFSYSYRSECATWQLMIRGILYLIGGLLSRPVASEEHGPSQWECGEPAAEQCWWFHEDNLERW